MCRANPGLSFLTFPGRNRMRTPCSPRKRKGARGCASLLALCLLMTLAPGPVWAQSVAERLDSILRTLDVSGSVIVTMEGETIVSSGYGMANRELGVPNTSSTKFRIGSITKQFTAMAVLLLQEQGRLHVHDRVGDYLSNVPESWQGLTIHQLLTHTSGLMHSWSLPGFAEIAMVPISLDETLELFFGEPLRFEPGTSYEYSGLGYFLLAKIVEVVSGHSYDGFLDTEIFAPLGMVDTGPDRPETLLEGRAAGYVEAQDGAVQNAPAIFAPILTGGGHLYSTVEDLSRWNRGLARQALISADAYEQMYRPEMQGYAYGWRVGRLRDKPTLSHGGGLPGFNAYILRLPEDDLCVVVLTNLTPGQARPVAEAVAMTVLGYEYQSWDSF